eukprot:gene7980-9487_t
MAQGLALGLIGKPAFTDAERLETFQKRVGKSMLDEEKEQEIGLQWPKVHMYDSKGMVDGSEPGRLLEQSQATRRIQLEDFCRLLTRLQPRCAVDERPLGDLRNGMLRYLSMEVLAWEQRAKDRDDKLHMERKMATEAELANILETAGEKVNEMQIKLSEEQQKSVKALMVERIKHAIVLHKDQAALSGMIQVEASHMENLEAKNKELEATVEEMKAQVLAREKEANAPRDQSGSAQDAFALKEQELQAALAARDAAYDEGASVKEDLQVSKAEVHRLKPLAQLGQQAEQYFDAMMEGQQELASRKKAYMKRISQKAFQYDESMAQIMNMLSTQEEEVLATKTRLAAESADKVERLELQLLAERSECIDLKETLRERQKVLMDKDWELANTHKRLARMMASTTGEIRGKQTQAEAGGGEPSMYALDTDTELPAWLSPGGMAKDELSVFRLDLQSALGRQKLQEDLINDLKATIATLSQDLGMTESFLVDTMEQRDLSMRLAAVADSLGKAQVATQELVERSSELCPAASLGEGDLSVSPQGAGAVSDEMPAELPQAPLSGASLKFISGAPKERYPNVEHEESGEGDEDEKGDAEQAEDEGGEGERKARKERSGPSEQEEAKNASPTVSYKTGRAGAAEQLQDSQIFIQEVVRILGLVENLLTRLIAGAFSTHCRDAAAKLLNPGEVQARSPVEVMDSVLGLHREFMEGGAKLGDERVPPQHHDAASSSVRTQMPPYLERFCAWAQHPQSGADSLRAVSGAQWRCAWGEKLRGAVAAAAQTLAACKAQAQQRELVAEAGTLYDSMSVLAAILSLPDVPRNGVGDYASHARDGHTHHDTPASTEGRSPNVPPLPLPAMDSVGAEPPPAGGAAPGEGNDVAFAAAAASTTTVDTAQLGRVAAEDATAAGSGAGDAGAGEEDAGDDTVPQRGAPEMTASQEKFEPVLAVMRGIHSLQSEGVGKTEEPEVVAQCLEGLATVLELAASSSEEMQTLSKQALKHLQ